MITIIKEFSGHRTGALVLIILPVGAEASAAGHKAEGGIVQQDLVIISANKKSRA
jgi:hypothetical protein